MTSSKIHILNKSWQRSLGAMFQKDLGRKILVFVYRRPAKRLFHTFFSPPLRILALNPLGQRVFEERVGSWQWVLLPPTRLVIECAPAMHLSDSDLEEILEAAGVFL